MQSFYTNVQVHGSKILYRGVENGRKVRVKEEYHPSLFLNSKDPTKFTTVTGNYVSEIKPGTIRDCREFIATYDNVSNFPIYGMQRYEYCYITEKFPGDIQWSKNLIGIGNIDIEVDSENGFPDPSIAAETITAITFSLNEKIYAFGLKDYTPSDSNVKYFKCADEIDLLKKFIELWSYDYPDILTGWNIKFFDIPYLFNRISKLLGSAWAKRLSPWNVLREREVFIMGRPQKTYLPLGIAIIDYLEAYKKFANKGNSRDSYKLDSICEIEIKEKKLSYGEYGNLHTLYRENFPLFMDYNLRDRYLVAKLDDKLKLIDLILTLAYDNKCNFEDVFAQVRMWDVIIYNHLCENNVVLPPTSRQSKDASYVGAYVKDPKLGMHEWVASFDLNSLYPALIQQYNISPDTIITPNNYTDGMRKILAQNINVDTLLGKKVDTSGLGAEKVTLTPNGQLFTTTKQGFLPKLMEKMYNDRVVYKDKAIKSKKELELIKQEIERRSK